MAKAMKPEAVSTMTSVFKNLRKVLLEECPSHAFFRGEIYQGPGDASICLDLLASNEEGNFVRVEVSHDLEDDKLFYSKGLKLVDDKKLSKALLEVVGYVEKQALPVSHIYFEVCPGFTEGSIEPDKKEPGSIIIYLMGKERSGDYSLCLSEASKIVGKKLAGTWCGRREDVI